MQDHLIFVLSYTEMFVSLSLSLALFIQQVINFFLIRFDGWDFSGYIHFDGWDLSGCSGISGFRFISEGSEYSVKMHF